MNNKQVPVLRAAFCAIFCVIFTALTVYQFTYYSTDYVYRQKLAEETEEVRAGYEARLLQAEESAQALRERINAIAGADSETAEDCLRYLLTQSLVRQSTAAGAGSATAITAQVDAYMATYASDAIAAAERLLFIDYLCREHYAGAYSASAWEEAVADAYVSATGDLYGRYYTEEEFAAFTRDGQSLSCGIGVIGINDTDGGAVRIVHVHAASPASSQLQAGDRIVGVDGKTVASDGLDAVRGAIAGEAGTRVSLTVERAGATFTCDVTRTEIETDTVVWRIEQANGKKLGYIRILDFNSKIGEQFAAACTALSEAGAETYIFDVRDNGGGQMSALRAVLSCLMPAGTEVCSYTYNNGSTRTSSLTTGTPLLTGPYYVLVNRYTASASELFAAALRDHGYATLIGEDTYGKGCMQTVYPLEDGSAVKMTVAQFYPPSGNSFAGEGVHPTIPVSQPAGQRETNIWLLTEETDAVWQRAVAEATR